MTTSYKAKQWRGIIYTTESKKLQKWTVKLTYRQAWDVITKNTILESEKVNVVTEDKFNELLNLSVNAIAKEVEKSN